MVKVAVLGAGINGLACAVQLKEKYKNFQVTLISNEFSPNTTGDGAGGLWFPYMYGTTSSKLITQWCSDTLAFLNELWQTGAVNICLMPVYSLFTDKEQLSKPDWLEIAYGYKELNSKQLEYFSERYSRKYTAGLTFVTFVTPTTKLLEYFTKRFKDAHGEILQANISSLQDPVLKKFDVIINCTGFGAKFLVSDDKMAPVRGQVQAPWLNEVVIDDSGHYIIPNVEACVLGGTHQDSSDTKLEPKDTEFILDGCCKRIPSLEHSKIVSQWVGLRPVREAIRVEPELVDGKLCIHNYGHGGSGFTLFWGCSNQVLKIFETYLNKSYLSNRTSKL
ncbi:unnamed protein product [Arctia plantaginis]|uniref:FAD dependent oxidoreductase domain-containing protein n=1 Tax=Arctia plantaginis TaxID=874455 RepID=A0A8S1AGZ4_ARCPL|nr:unnamed protein product [Arctia plantaginis]CAB3253921.1 unnamed protein product [Arctia plantaginis]